MARIPQRPRVVSRVSLRAIGHQSSEWNCRRSVNSRRGLFHERRAKKRARNGRGKRRIRSIRRNNARFARDGGYDFSRRRIITSNTPDDTQAIRRLTYARARIHYTLYSADKPQRCKRRYYWQGWTRARQLVQRRWGTTRRGRNGIAWLVPVVRCRLSAQSRSMLPREPASSPKSCHVI